MAYSYFSSECSLLGFRGNEQFLGCVSTLWQVVYLSNGIPEGARYREEHHGWDVIGDNAQPPIFSCFSTAVLQK